MIQFLALDVVIIFEPSSTTLIKQKQLNDEQVYNIKDHSSSALPTAGKTASTLKPNQMTMWPLFLMASGGWY